MAAHVSITLYLFDPVHLSAVTQMSALTQDTEVISASVGDNVTLHCFYDSQVAMHFSWYRQTLGKEPQRLSTVYKYDKSSNQVHWSEKNPRFSVDWREGTNHLHISDIQFSDSASYFCGSSHSNMVEFGEGVFLSVKGIVFIFLLGLIYCMWNAKAARNLHPQQ